MAQRSKQRVGRLHPSTRREAAEIVDVAVALRALAEAGENWGGRADGIFVELLETLRARQGAWCPVNDLAERLNCKPGKIRSGVRDLRKMSYLIETDPERGVRFTGAQDLMLSYEIQRHLETSVLGHTMLCLDEVASTNDVVWEAAAKGASEGLAVFAEHQTGGRGRFRRAWFCPPHEGILFSVLLRPRLPAERVSALTTTAAVAVAEALQENWRVPALIRWPNDIVVRDAKLGGLLVEARRLDGGAAFVLGIGLNANVAADQFPANLRTAATSIREILGRNVDRNEVARGVVRSLDRWYGELRDGHDELISSHWRRYSASLGQRLTVAENGRSYTGRVLDLSLTDGLLLRLDGGVTRVFDGARVTVDHDG